MLDDFLEFCLTSEDLSPESAEHFLNEGSVATTDPELIPEAKYKLAIELGFIQLTVHNFRYIKETSEDESVPLHFVSRNLNDFMEDPLGYGLTIGNSLRRILLSSIRGTAVTAIQIDLKKQLSFKVQPQVPFL